MPPPTDLLLSTNGLLKQLDLTGVADGTELHGWNGWQVYVAAGPATGIYEVRTGAIQNKVNVTSFVMALWGHADVANRGHAVQADIQSADWTGNPLGGLCANGWLDHSEDTRILVYNTYEARVRSTIADYGAGFAMRTGAMPGAPLTNGTAYRITFGMVQDDSLSNPRWTAYIGGSGMGAPQDTPASTGTNTGTSYPGLGVWNQTPCRFTSYKVCRDYRLTLRNLTGTQGFRLYDTLGNVLKSSAAQSGGTAYVSVADLTWPVGGYVQLFNDAGTWASPTTGGRYPGGGTTSIWAGSIFQQPTPTAPVVQVNWNADDGTTSVANEWAVPTGKDVSAVVKELHLVSAAANPHIEVDTLTIILADPNGTYVPGNTGSALYPNVREGREVRCSAVVSNGTTVSEFYGTIAEVQPDLAGDEQRAVVRVESPLRAVATSRLTLTGPLEGVLIEADRVTGVIPTLLALVPTIVPAANWDFDELADSIPADFITANMDWLTALQQCLLYADALMWVEPVHRTTLGGPTGLNWKLRIQRRDAKLAVAADQTWSAANGDINELRCRFTADQL